MMSKQYALPISRKSFKLLYDSIKALFQSHIIFEDKCCLDMLIQHLLINPFMAKGATNLPTRHFPANMSSCCIFGIELLQHRFTQLTAINRLNKLAIESKLLAQPFHMLFFIKSIFKIDDKNGDGVLTLHENTLSDI